MKKLHLRASESQLNVMRAINVVRGDANHQILIGVSALFGVGSFDPVFFPETIAVIHHGSDSSHKVTAFISHDRTYCIVVNRIFEQL
jgi:hypothetical protein